MSNLPNSIFLIGYRGCGKTTVAKLLAERAGWTWLDADAYLEEKFALAIRAIFAAEGESGFRDKESQILREIARLTQHIIATGGGIILRDENRRLLKSAGTVVWLKASAATLWQRIVGDHTTHERRPDLAGGGFDEVVELLQQRESLYEQCADLTVDTEERTPGDIADELWHRLFAT